jgi:tetratricopeptide (TPR) repeat protein
LHLSTARSFVAESEQTEAAQALAIYERLGDRMGMIRTLVQLGNSENAQGEYAAAVAYYERGLALSQEIGDRQTEASCLINLAIIAKRRQEYEKSRDLSQRSMSLFRETGAQMGVATALNNLGDLAQLSAAYAEAQNWYGESLTIRLQSGDQLGAGLLYYNLSRAALSLGRRDEAGERLKRALTIAQEIGSTLLLMLVLVGAAHYLAAGERPSRAVELLRLVSHHPASNKQTLDEAGRLLQTLGAASGAVAPDAAEAVDLARLVADLLTEL